MGDRESLLEFQYITIKRNLYAMAEKNSLKGGLLTDYHQEI
jgi:hypothetical protein